MIYEIPLACLGPGAPAGALGGFAATSAAVNSRSAASAVQSVVEPMVTFRQAAALVSKPAACCKRLCGVRKSRSDTIQFKARTGDRRQAGPATRCSDSSAC